MYVCMRMYVHMCICIDIAMQLAAKLPSEFKAPGAH